MYIQTMRRPVHHAGFVPAMASSNNSDKSLRSEAVASPFVHYASLLTYSKHEAVYFAGDEASRLYEVMSGAVMIYQLLDDGRRQVVELVLPGGVCGFAAADKYSSTCETLTETTLRSYRKSDIRESDLLQAYLSEKAEKQVCAMHEHALSLGRKTAEERVSTLLARFLDHSETGASLDLPMTRGEMGDYLGLSLETVCRTLTELQRQTVIEVGRRHGEVSIKNVRKLRRIAGLDRDF